jgi:hypothetical protein
MNLPHSVEVVEVGPRDGLQNEAAMVPMEGMAKGVTLAWLRR